jgi:hypothetical protein
MDLIRFCECEIARTLLFADPLVINQPQWLLHVLAGSISARWMHDIIA